MIAIESLVCGSAGHFAHWKKTQTESGPRTWSSQLRLHQSLPDLREDETMTTRFSEHTDKERKATENCCRIKHTNQRMRETAQ